MTCAFLNLLYQRASLYMCVICLDMFGTVNGFAKLVNLDVSDGSRAVSAKNITNRFSDL